MKSYSFLKKYLLAATATAALLFSACDLDEHPTSFVGPKEYYKTRAQCLAGLNACYIPINSIYDYCFLIMTEGVTDLMYITSGTKDAQLDISPAKPLNGEKIWTPCYKGVMYCNSTIAAIERSPLSPREVADIVAFLNALSSDSLLARQRAAAGKHAGAMPAG